MEILSSAIYDKKIQSYNIIMELSLIEYYEFIKSSMLDNEFQRNKVRSSKTIYALLKQDLITGCVIPPIVLAMNVNIDEEERNQFGLSKENYNRKQAKYIHLRWTSKNFYYTRYMH